VGFARGAHPRRPPGASGRETKPAPSALPIWLHYIVLGRPQGQATALPGSPEGSEAAYSPARAIACASFRSTNQGMDRAHPTPKSVRHFILAPCREPEEGDWLG
jgi:hypothetical protein